MSTQNRQLRIGVPSKGRLSELARSFYSSGTELPSSGSIPFRPSKQFSADITFLRTDDIPTLCAEGAIDLGITGSDLVQEAAAPVNVRMKLGVGRCRLACAFPFNPTFTTHRT